MQSHNSTHQQIGNAAPTPAPSFSNGSWRRPQHSLAHSAPQRNAAQHGGRKISKPSAKRVYVYILYFSDLCGHQSSASLCYTHITHTSHSTFASLHLTPCHLPPAPTNHIHIRTYFQYSPHRAWWPRNATRRIALHTEICSWKINIKPPRLWKRYKRDFLAVLFALLFFTVFLFFALRNVSCISRERTGNRALSPLRRAVFAMCSVRVFVHSLDCAVRLLYAACWMSQLYMRSLAFFYFVDAGLKFPIVASELPLADWTICAVDVHM